MLTCYTSCPSCGTFLLRQNTSYLLPTYIEVLSDKLLFRSSFGWHLPLGNYINNNINSDKGRVALSWGMFHVKGMGCRVQTSVSISARQSKYFPPSSSWLFLDFPPFYIYFAGLFSTFMSAQCRPSSCVCVCLCCGCRRVN